PRSPRTPPPFPSTTLFRSYRVHLRPHRQHRLIAARPFVGVQCFMFAALDNRGVLIHRSDLLLRTTFSQSPDQILVHFSQPFERLDRKSTRLNSSHGSISYA